MEKANALRAAVIMAGGSGERFWPLSRNAVPKQLLKFGALESNLLDQTIDNIAPIFPKESVFLATGTVVGERVRGTLEKIPPGNVIIEPFKRNTAGCIVLSAAHLLARYGGDGSNITMAVFPADHVIAGTATFHALVSAAMDMAEVEDALVTFAIKPTRPETGYGYLELSPSPLTYEGSSSDIPAFPVLRFCEKPNRGTAEHYIATGRFHWNSGMFFWRISTLLDELRVAAPVMADAVLTIAAALKANDEGTVRATFESLDTVSIDYALMEKANRVLAIRANMDWDDVGVWDSLDRMFPRDTGGNVVYGDPVLFDTRDCIVFNDPGAEAMAVGIIGVEGLAVIVTGDAILVVPKDRAQDVKKIVGELKKRNAPQI